MPKTLISGKNIYYEVYGEGEPLVLLNGIMMSTLSWKAFINAFSKNNKLILIDFIDQGQSDKSEKLYTHDLHVETIKGLLDYLHIKKVHLAGVSYGAAVAMKFALSHQNRLLTLSLANATSYTTYMLKDIGQSWINASKTYDGATFFKATIPTIYSVKFYEKNIEWLRNREKLFSQVFTKEWYDGFIRLVKSAESLNITDELYKIKVPTMIIGSEYDLVTPIDYQQEIYNGIENSRFTIIKDAGHASMYEKPHEFISIITGFISTYNEKLKIL
ncbi:MAG: alpha/beta hydrolase [Firmicutes bacterium]|nr:alpha/beta hydrolase [Bacillota bacterium]